MNKQLGLKTDCNLICHCRYNDVVFAFHQVLTEKARSGSLLAGECEGGTFT